jgi:hypothetical protein
MDFTTQFDTENVDWAVVAAMYERAGFSATDPEALRAAFEGSQVVCFGRDGARLIGAGRIEGGKVRDLCVLPSHVGYGPGLVMYEWLARLAKLENPPILAEGEAERALVEKAELAEHLGA